MAQIMIVEDNQGTNKAICEYLKTAGHTLFPALDGEEALNIFRDNSIDLAVLDIMLSSVWGRQKNLQTAPQNSLVLITPNRKKGTASFLLLLRLLSRLLPFRYMLLRNQEKYQKEQSDKPTRQQIYRLRARLPLIFRKSFWLLGLQQQLLLFC